MTYHGGPAFPWAGTRTGPESRGMTLRDYFAAAVIQGLMSNSGGPWQANPMSGTGWCNSNAKGTADIAYEIADAMLVSRERKTK